MGSMGDSTRRRLADAVSAANAGGGGRAANGGGGGGYAGMAGSFGRAATGRGLDPAKDAASPSPQAR